MLHLPNFGAGLQPLCVCGGGGEGGKGGLGNNSPQVKSNLLPDFINKNILKHRYTYFVDVPSMAAFV